MRKYEPVTVFDECPCCTRLVRFTALASWTDYEPTHLNCPHCKATLRFTREGTLVEMEKEVAP